MDQEQVDGVQVKEFTSHEGAAAAAPDMKNPAHSDAFQPVKVVHSFYLWFVW